MKYEWVSIWKNCWNILECHLFMWKFYHGFYHALCSSLNESVKSGVCCSELQVVQLLCKMKTGLIFSIQYVNKISFSVVQLTLWVAVATLLESLQNKHKPDTLFCLMWHSRSNPNIVKVFLFWTCLSCLRSTYSRVHSHILMHGNLPCKREATPSTLFAYRC